MTGVRRRASRTWAITLTAAVLVLAVAGAFWFQPWKLVVDDTVDEALPSAAATVPAAAAASPAQNPPPSPDGPVVLASGEFITHEHATTGSASIVRLPDGSRVLRLTDLDTSNGPDLRVWITDAPVKAGWPGWHIFDDGEYRSLGALKGNQGSQNYPLPADLRVDRYTSVSIWCDRFDVSFGAAPLTAV